MEEVILKDILIRPIGIVHSPFYEPAGTPIQPGAALGVKGMVEVFPEYAEGLKDVDGFSHVTLVFYFHLAGEPKLTAKPFLDDQERGVFAIRGPARPNHIGISTVRLVSVEGNVLHVENLDILNGTPLLDIKPYVPAFDDVGLFKTGWLEEKIVRLNDVRDDGRFEGD